MENVRQHLQSSFDEADKAYWDLYMKYEGAKKELQQLQSEVSWMAIDMEKLNNERKYFTKLLNELNNETNG